MPVEPDELASPEPLEASSGSVLLAPVLLAPVLLAPVLLAPVLLSPVLLLAPVLLAPVLLPATAVDELPWVVPVGSGGSGGVQRDRARQHRSA